MTIWIPTLVALFATGLLLICFMKRRQTPKPVPDADQSGCGHSATIFAAAVAPPAAHNSLPILLVQPIPRERLKYLSPFVVGGWDSQKSQRIAAWLRQMGGQDPGDPWALILWAREDSIPMLLETYGNLPGWSLFVNEHPPAEAIAERVYLVEGVWHLPEEGIRAPELAEIAILVELGAVIIVPDPEGMVPDYLEPARDLANHTLGTISWSHVIGLAGFPLPLDGNGNGNGHAGGGYS